MQLQCQKINCVWRNAITTPEDKLCPEEHDYDSGRSTVPGGTRLRVQMKNCARRNAITTPDDKLFLEECDYDSR